MNSVTPSLQQARVCPPNMLPEDGTNLYSARGILSFIQSSTRRAYQQVLDVLDENRRWLVVTDSASFCCFFFFFLPFSGVWFLFIKQWDEIICFCFPLLSLFISNLIVQNSHFKMLLFQSNITLRFPST